MNQILDVPYPIEDAIVNVSNATFSTETLPTNANGESSVQLAQLCYDMYAKAGSTWSASDVQNVCVGTTTEATFIVNSTNITQIVQLQVVTDIWNSSAVDTLVDFSVEATIGNEVPISSTSAVDGVVQFELDPGCWLFVAQKEDDPYNWQPNSLVVCSRNEQEASDNAANIPQLVLTLAGAYLEVQVLSPSGTAIQFEEIVVTDNDNDAEYTFVTDANGIAICDVPVLSCFTISFLSETLVGLVEDVCIRDYAEQLANATVTLQLADIVVPNEEWNTLIEDPENGNVASTSSQTTVTTGLTSPAQWNPIFDAITTAAGWTQGILTLPAKTNDRFRFSMAEYQYKRYHI